MTSAPPRDEFEGASSDSGVEVAFTSSSDTTEPSGFQGRVAANQRGQSARGREGGFNAGMSARNHGDSVRGRGASGEVAARGARRPHHQARRPAPLRSDEPLPSASGGSDTDMSHRLARAAGGSRLAPGDHPRASTPRSLNVDRRRDSPRGGRGGEDGGTWPRTPDSAAHQQREWEGRAGSGAGARSGRDVYRSPSGRPSDAHDGGPGTPRSAASRATNFSQLSTARKAAQMLAKARGEGPRRRPAAAGGPTTSSERSRGLSMASVVVTAKGAQRARAAVSQAAAAEYVAPNEEQRLLIAKLSGRDAFTDENLGGDGHMLTKWSRIAMRVGATLVAVSAILQLAAAGRLASSRAVNPLPRGGLRFTMLAAFTHTVMVAVFIYAAAASSKKLYMFYAVGQVLALVLFQIPAWVVMADNAGTVANYAAALAGSDGAAAVPSAVIETAHFVVDSCCAETLSSNVTAVCATLGQAGFVNCDAADPALAVINRADVLMTALATLTGVVLFLALLAAGFTGAALFRLVQARWGKESVSGDVLGDLDGDGDVDEEDEKQLRSFCGRFKAGAKWLWRPPFEHDEDLAIHAWEPEFNREVTEFWRRDARGRTVMSRASGKAQRIPVPEVNYVVVLEEKTPDKLKEALVNATTKLEATGKLSHVFAFMGGTISKPGAGVMFRGYIKVGTNRAGLEAEAERIKLMLRLDPTRLHERDVALNSLSRVPKLFADFLGAADEDDVERRSLTEQLLYKRRAGSMALFIRQGLQFRPYTYVYAPFVPVSKQKKLGRKFQAVLEVDALNAAKAGMGDDSSSVSSSDEEEALRQLDKSGAPRPRVPPLKYRMYRSTKSKFDPVAKLRLVRSIIESDPDHGAGIRTSNSIAQVFPVHDPYERTLLKSKWLRWWKVPWMQPLAHIRAYFGERRAYYFAWLAFYTKWLVLPSVIGLGVYVHQVVAGTVAVAELTAFGMFVAVWGTLFIEFWKRREATLAMEWGTAKMTAKEDINPEFARTARYKPSRVTGLPEEHLDKGAYRMRNFVGLLVVGMLIVVVLFCVLGIFVLRAVLVAMEENDEIPPSWAGYITGAVNAGQIAMFNAVYKKVAIVLNNWEHHPTRTSYQKSLIIKVFLFYFINSYFSLFYIAFVKRNWGGTGIVERCQAIPRGGEPDCIGELRQQLSSIFVSRLVGGNISEVLAPLISEFVNAKILHKSVSVSEETSQVEVEADMSEYDITFELDDWVEMIVQFGYVSMFVVAYPLVPLLALVSNIFEQRIDAFKMLHQMKRPDPVAAAGIGTWLDVLEVLSRVAVISNIAVVMFGTEARHRTSLDDPLTFVVADATRVWIFFVLAMVVMMLKRIADIFVADVPSNVVRQLQRGDYLVQKHVDGRRDDLTHFYSAEALARLEQVRLRAAKRTRELRAASVDKATMQRAQRASMDSAGGASPIVVHDADLEPRQEPESLLHDFFFGGRAPPEGKKPPSGKKKSKSSSRDKLSRSGSTVHRNPAFDAIIQARLAQHGGEGVDAGLLDQKHDEVEVDVERGDVDVDAASHSTSTSGVHEGGAGAGAQRGSGWSRFYAANGAAARGRGGRGRGGAARGRDYDARRGSSAGFGGSSRFSAGGGDPQRRRSRGGMGAAASRGGRGRGQRGSSRGFGGMR